MQRCSNTAENGNKSKATRARLWGRIALPVLLLALTVGLTGCSWTFPGSKTDAAKEIALEDDIATGSIGPVSEPKKPLAQLKNLTEEDLRRAKAALAVAVDPHGSPDRVLWDNPQTQAKGSFVPDGPPFVKNDEVCRNFRTLVVDPVETRNLVGTACRPSGGAWDVSDIKAPPKAQAPAVKPGKPADSGSAKKPVAAKAVPKPVAKAKV